MKYGLLAVLKKIPEFQQLKQSKKGYSGPLGKYNNKTIEDFINDYKNNGLKGRAVYDELIKLIAPEVYESMHTAHKIIKVKPNIPEKYSNEDLYSHNQRVIPYVSNVHQSIGKLMDVTINQAIWILNRHSTSFSLKYANVLKYFFIEHKSIDEIVKTVKDTRWNIQGFILNKFMEGGEYYSNIIISDDFKQQVTDFISPLLFQVCDTAFEDNDIDTHEKIKFALNLSGYDVLDDMKEWGNVKILTNDSYIGITRQHLISLKKAICDAIVPVSLPNLIERTKDDFISKNDSSEFNSRIIECFVQSHPWIQTDEEGKYYILTPYLTTTYQRQGRIIYEAGEPIHHDKVRSIYQSIYREDYKSPGIQNSLKKRVEHDFFPYGRTGLWYYSENGTEIKPVNTVLAKFVDEHIIFYWKDLATVVGQLCLLNKKFTKRRIRGEVTNLCYVDNNDKDHFVKKGEEVNYPSFSWSKSKQNRTNWCVNHAYDILKESHNGEMMWTDFVNQFTQDLIETGRPLKVVEDIKYKHSGAADEGRVFIRENDIIRINDVVVETLYNGDLSMYGIYRKYSEYYNVIFSLAMTELRKQQDNKMLLVDFINIALNNIESDGKIDSIYIRKLFSGNNTLPLGLSRYNDNGSVFIKYDPSISDVESDDKSQFVITNQPSDEVEGAPRLIVSEENRQPVTYTTRFNWLDVKKALKADLAFYDSPFWYPGITSDAVLDKFINILSSSGNYNLNDLVPQIVYEFHYARIDRYDLNQYMRNLPVAFEALLREIYESSHQPIRLHGIKSLCENGFTDFDEALKRHDKKGFGRILNDLVQKRNLLLHGANLELSIVTLNQSIVEYIALFVYTVDKYSLNI